MAKPKRVASQVATPKPPPKSLATPKRGKFSWWEISKKNDKYRLRLRGYKYDANGQYIKTTSGKSYKRWFKHVGTFSTREAADTYRAMLKAADESIKRIGRNAQKSDSDVGGGGYRTGGGKGASDGVANRGVGGG